MMAQNTTDGRWHILLTQPQREITAAAGLTGRQFKAYLPQRICERRQGPQRKRVEVSLPLMPGYLFVRLNPTLGLWDRVRSIPGVRGFLEIQGCKATLSDAAMDLLHHIEKTEDEQRVVLGRKNWSFKVGDHVRVSEDGGIHSGLEGVVQRIDKNDKAVLEVVLPSRAWRLITSAAWLQKAG